MRIRPGMAFGRSAKTSRCRWPTMEEVGPRRLSPPGRWPCTSTRQRATRSSRISPVVRFVFGGIFERHPKLKLIQTEQVGAWYGQVLDELDSRWGAFRHQIGDLVPRLPSDYCRENYFVGASFQSRHEAETAIREGYVENMMWGSDYPHPEGTYHYPERPDEPAMTHLAMRNTYSGLPHKDIRSMLGENAVRVYGLDGEELRRVAERITAPSLGELSRPLEERPTHWGLAFRTSAFYS